MGIVVILKYVFFFLVQYGGGARNPLPEPSAQG